MSNINEIKATIGELILWQKLNKKALKRSGMYGSFHFELTIQEAELILSLLDENELGVLDSDSEQHGDLHAVAACNAPSSQSEKEIEEDKQRSLPPITEAENSCKCGIPWGKYDYRCMDCDEINPHHLSATMKDS